ncbi:MAG: glycosyltransferase [Clostridia bacterium]|nr:glycosyltransferase [Clostridia bacterium]
MNKKKILIVTYYYKHKNAMASVRAIKLAKYFARQGHEVTVLTSNQKDTWTKSYCDPVADESIREIYAPQIARWGKISAYLSHRQQVGQQKIAQAQSENEKAPVVQKQSLKGKLISFLKWIFYFFIATQEDICMFKGLKAEAKRQALQGFDTVIATYPTYGAFLTGIWLKKKGVAKSLIADFRDPLYNPGFRDKKTEASYDKKCLRNIVKHADKIVCVSKGIADGIVAEIPHSGKTIEIITNGYDKDDVTENSIQVNFDKSKINFVYTGALYHGKRCVNMLASVLKKLIDDGRIQPDSFAFHYAGADFPELISQLSEYGLQETAVDHGFVSREESIALQKNGSALLLLTWNEKNYQGVVPGKLFEYMSMGNVPIIALVTGDVVNSEVTVFVREAGAGCACEEAAPPDMKALEAFVEKLFSGEASQQCSTDKFDYKNISKRYSDIM